MPLPSEKLLKLVLSITLNGLLAIVKSGLKTKAKIFVPYLNYHIITYWSPECYDYTFNVFCIKVITLYLNYITHHIIRSTK